MILGILLIVSAFWPPMLIAQTADTTPPTLVDFAFTPATIDTTAGDAIVTVSMHLADSGAGVCASLCSGGSPPQVHFEHPSGQGREALLTLVVGTLTDGISLAQISFPKGSALGSWTAYDVVLVDRSGNASILHTADLTAKGFPTQLTNTEHVEPTSQVLPLAPLQLSPSFDVQWSGADSGSGIQSYTIFVAEAGGAPAVWLSDTTATAATFSGQLGRTYAFYSVARDHVGNVESTPSAPDTGTTVSIGSCVGLGPSLVVGRVTRADGQPLPNIPLTIFGPGACL